MNITITRLLSALPLIFFMYSAQAVPLVLGEYAIDKNWSGWSHDGPQLGAIANGLNYAGEVNTASLANIDIIVAGNYDAQFTSWVANGGALIWHNGWQTVQQGFPNVLLPGFTGLTYTGLHSKDIDLVSTTSPIINGPFGQLTNSNMDNGRWSTHGYVNLASLTSNDPLVTDITAILSTGNPDQITEFSYRYGKGLIIFSVMPMEAYTGSKPLPSAGTIGLKMLANNEIAYAKTFNHTQSIPEPAPILLIAIAMLSLLRYKKHAY